MAQKVLITGGSGSVGSQLSNLLLSKGYEVAWLSRKARDIGKIKVYAWDLTSKYIDPAAFQNTSYIVHLAGEGIADKKWTPKRKKEIIDSRVEGTKLLFENVQKLDLKLKAFITSSAIGYYGGDTGNVQNDENSPVGKDFLAEVCNLWELEAIKFQDLGIRTVAIRTGIVLDANHGALQKLALPVKYGVGTYLSNGNQWMSWIHLDDLCEMFAKSIEDQGMYGVYNGVAPNPETNKEFSKLLAKQLNRWILPLYVPSFVFKLLFGEMGIVVTGSSYVVCRRISETDFSFKYRTLDSALKQCYP